MAVSALPTAVAHRLSQLDSVADPLERLERAAELGREMDAYRSQVADAKGQAAVVCAAAGITQAQMAERCGVHAAMAQQWVRRGRGLPPH